MIKFINNGLYNAKFNDIYFDITDPLLECKHTYSSVLNDTIKENLVVAEAGFGTGLNFFSTILELNNRTLHYIAVEKYPFTKLELKQIYLRFPCFSALFEEFIGQYEIVYDSLIRIKMLTGKIMLDIYFGDILKAFDELDFKADIWYLDGFSPIKNPQMWSDELFCRLSEFCKYGSKIRTFSSSKIVKDKLSNFGFHIKKLKGAGRKREILEASYFSQKQITTKEIWYKAPKISNFENILIIGAGISGLMAGYKFSKAGFNVIIAEKYDNVAKNGSSNLAGILMPLILKKEDNLGKMHMSAFLMASNFYKGSKFAQFCGAESYATNEIKLKRYKNWGDNEIFHIVDGDPYPKAVIKKAGQIQPKLFCEDLSKIFDIKFGYEFYTLKKINDEYEVMFKNGKSINSKLVIFATGDSSDELFKSSFKDDFMQLSSVRGQVTHIKEILHLKSPFSAKGYICKGDGGLQVIGATYDRNDFFNEVRNTDNNKNISNLIEFLGDENIEILGGNTAFRGYSGDRFPLIGGIHNSDKFKEIYKNLFWTKNKRNNHAPIHYQNILISTAHGSRGLCTAVFGAEILLDMVLGRQICTTNTILNSLNPARFLIRKLKKGLV